MPRNNVAVVAPSISESARSLASALEGRYRRRDRRYLRARSVETLINWGNSSHIREAGVTYSQIWNTQEAVNFAANKRSAFRVWANSAVNNLEFTTNRAVAHRWLTNGETDRVYCRTTLRGNSGDGIVVARNVDDVVIAPLYTKGVDIHHEFRFHILDGVVFDGVRKAFRSDVPEESRNRDVMNHAAGTIFVRSGPALGRASQNQAMMDNCALAVQTLGLDFGAVDVLVDREGQHHIIEVNTACGLEGTTLERYARAFTEKLNGQPITPWTLEEFSGQPEAPTTPEILQQEEQHMTINDVVVGISVVFNPTSGNIQTLTRGNSYQVTRIGREVIYVRNDNGRIQGYRPAHFTSTPVTAPTVEFVGPSDGSIDTTEQPNSPRRVVLLEDGSSVNVTGTAIFTGESRRLHTDERYTIADMWIGRESGDVFLGVEVEGDIYRFLVSNFSEGTVNVSEIPEATTGTTVPQGPRVVDVDGVILRHGDNILVHVGAGGHNLAVGTLAVVSAVAADRISVQVEGMNSPVRIQPSRVRKITVRERDQLIAEAAALEAQQTTEFTIGGHSYRVAQRDMNELHQVLRRYTV